MQAVPELLTALLIIEDLDADLTLAGDSRTNFGDGNRRRRGTLQETTVAPQHFRRRITCQFEECLVCEHDRKIRLSPIGDDHWHPGAFKCDRCQLLPIGGSCF